MAINPNDITTVRVGELPSASFNLTDNIPHEVGTDLKRGTIQELIDFITPFIGAISKQVITLDVDAAYITDNFDETGLGINLMDGYAICNGNNGTLNRDGRVSVAYGNTHFVVGQFGGEANHTLTANELPAHQHYMFANVVSNSAVAATDNYISKQRDVGGADDKYAYGVTDGGLTVPSVGKSGQTGLNIAHNNMQPYIVTLTVMRL